MCKTDAVTDLMQCTNESTFSETCLHYFVSFSLSLYTLNTIMTLQVITALSVKFQQLVYVQIIQLFIPLLHKFNTCLELQSNSPQQHTDSPQQQSICPYYQSNFSQKKSQNLSRINQSQYHAKPVFPNANNPFFEAVLYLLPIYFQGSLAKFYLSVFPVDQFIMQH